MAMYFPFRRYDVPVNGTQLKQVWQYADSDPIVRGVLKRITSQVATHRLTMSIERVDKKLPELSPNAKRVLEKAYRTAAFQYILYSIIQGFMPVLATKTKVDDGPVESVAVPTIPDRSIVRAFIVVDVVATVRCERIIRGAWNTPVTEKLITLQTPYCPNARDGTLRSDIWALYPYYRYFFMMNQFSLSAGYSMSHPSLVVKHVAPDKAVLTDAMGAGGGMGALPGLPRIDQKEALDTYGGAQSKLQADAEHRLNKAQDSYVAKISAALKQMTKFLQSPMLTATDTVPLRHPAEDNIVPLAPGYEMGTQPQLPQIPPDLWTRMTNYKEQVVCTLGMAPFMAGFGTSKTTTSATELDSQATVLTLENIAQRTQDAMLDLFEELMPGYTCKFDIPVQSMQKPDDLYKAHGYGLLSNEALADAVGRILAMRLEFQGDIPFSPEIRGKLEETRMKTEATMEETKIKTQAAKEIAATKAKEVKRARFE